MHLYYVNRLRLRSTLIYCSGKFLSSLTVLYLASKKHKQFPEVVRLIQV